MSGKLYIIPTPLGNLRDITLRALDILKEADVILAEDTRHTRKLLKHFEIDKPLWAYHKFNERNATQGVIKRLIEDDLKVGLVSDAGTPGISDPGLHIIQSCIEHHIEVECLPGPTAFVPALVLSGFDTSSFCFEGFLPHKKGRQTKLKILVEETRNIILYESPYRLIKLLQQIQEYFGDDRRVSVSRELSKIYEETNRGLIADVLNYYKNKDAVKGEIVVVIEGKQNKK